VLRHLRQRLDQVQHRLAPFPQVLRDIGDRGPGQGGPAAPALDPRHPVAQLVPREEPRPGEVAPGEPPQRHRHEQPGERGVLHPLPGDGDALRVLLDRRLDRAQSGRVGGEAGDQHVGLAAPVGRVRRVGKLRRVGRGRRGEPFDHDGPVAERGPPDADGGRAGAAR
jgi:hypothetical protein